MNSDKSNRHAESSGVVYGNVGVGETTYEMNRFHGHQGHGFAAERAEHINDLTHGREAQILGDDNAKNGADRLVNGVEIQSKYCRSGNACIQECFRDGHYRYYSQNGKPMQVEVPSDMYDEAVLAMRRRIEAGQVDGITDPNKSVDLVRKGHYTYEQARKIAQSGTIESLTFDSVNGAIIGASSFGISATISFALSIWNGEDIQTALENAVLTGIKVGGVSFVTTVITSQIARTAINSTIRMGTDYVVKKLGPKVTSYIATALNNGTNIYGTVAMNNVSKLLSGNIIATFTSLIVLSAADIIDFFRGRISKEQLFKDVTITGATIAGGTIGWGAGNIVGGAIGGTVGGAFTGGTGARAGAEIGAKVGGFVVSAVAGSVSGGTTQAVLDEIIEDDADKIMRLIQTEFVSICEQYLLTENEIEEILTKLKNKLDSKELKNIFASQNRELYIQSIILSIVFPIVNNRKSILLVESDEIMLAIRTLFEDAIDGEGVFETEGMVPSLAEVKQNLLANTNIKEEQIENIMRPVAQMNRTNMQAERALRSMKRSNEDTEYALRNIYEERQRNMDILNEMIKK